MNVFFQPLSELNEYTQIQKFMKKESGVLSVTGCIDSQMVHFMEGIAKSHPARHKIIVTFNEIKAKEIYEDFKLYDREVVYYPAKDFIFFNADIHGNLMVKERLSVIKRCLMGEPVTLVTTIDGLLDKILPKEMLKKHPISMMPGDQINLEDMRKRLIAMGYEYATQVEAPGQFSVRGSILDIFAMTEEVPYRIDLWDEEVDSIRSFDVESQRSVENLERIDLYPATEYILTQEQLENGKEKILEDKNKCVEQLRGQFKTEESYRLKTAVEEFCEQLEISRTGLAIDAYATYFYPDLVCLLDYFSKEDTLIFVDEPTRVRERATVVETEFRESMMHRLEKGYILPGQMDVLWDPKRILNEIANRKTLVFTTLEQKIKGFEVKEKFHLQVRNVNPYHNRFELLVKDLEKYKKQGYRMLILSGSKTRAERLAENLREFELPAIYSKDLERKLQPGEIMTCYGNLHKGFEYPFIKFVVIAESDIFGDKKQKKKKKRTYSGQKIQSFTDLNIGDYVVHENHGLGIYRGIEKIEVDKIIKDYIKIEYAGNGNLYILATQLDLLQKYANADAKKPKLNKLGSQEWVKTKTRVRSAVKDIARDLVELYAKRQEKSGYVYGEDTVWQKEFEELFPYEETEDQLVAIEETKRDMQSKKIMDRLICGDVGYGKTEIAIRAAFKAVQEGKQVVFLVPTTILAQQHYNTFAQRMKDFPVRVDMLSRFRTAKEQKKTLDDLRKGMVDIVIGTHRVLSKDVIFKDLGLLIIDEEQRFGVTHKERIKTWKENVDVLTLTATPIPRTLHMSLVGIRDMSVLEEPPVDRLPIQTFVMEYNDEMVREAIGRELARNGQVYYVYNRVGNIEDITSQIAKLVPDAVVTYAHGQMSERKLEQIMYSFVQGEIDVLISTTIIETGLDISNVNTMIIHDADQLGLAQLYQLRGRVGRSNRTSYAFLMYKRDKMLKEVAEKRLQAIREFTELGSGFKIAMRDLEIRGAGNILGAQQHGHMQAVGYDLYCKMLNEAVLTMKGMEQPEDFETTVDLDLDAYIPASYIKNEYQKLDIYKRIAGIENQEEYEEMQDELLDRFGDLPKAVEHLLEIALLKSKAHKIMITEISGNRTQMKFILYPQAKIDVNRIAPFVESYQNRMKFVPQANPYFVYTPVKPYKTVKDWLEALQELLGSMECLKE